MSSKGRIRAGLDPRRNWISPRAVGLTPGGGREVGEAGFHRVTSSPPLSRRPTNRASAGSTRTGADSRPLRDGEAAAAEPCLIFEGVSTPVQHRRQCRCPPPSSHHRLPRPGRANALSCCRGSSPSIAGRGRPGQIEVTRAGRASLGLGRASPRSGLYDVNLDAADPGRPPRELPVTADSIESRPSWPTTTRPYGRHDRLTPGVIRRSFGIPPATVPSSCRVGPSPCRAARSISGRAPARLTSNATPFEQVKGGRRASPGTGTAATVRQSRRRPGLPASDLGTSDRIGLQEASRREGKPPCSWRGVADAADESGWPRRRVPRLPVLIISSRAQVSAGQELAANPG